MSLIDIVDETIGWRERAVLRDVCLTLREGDRIALLGRSGAGKSTLLTHLYRMLVARGEAVALVPQDHALVPALSVFHNIYMGRLDRRGALYNLANLVRPFRREVEAARPIAAALGIEGEMFRTVESLSGGQKQRTAVARALFRGGRVALGDEPVSAVDERQAVAILQTIRAQFGTFVLALHDVALAKSTCDRIIGLSQGRIAFELPAAAVGRRELDALY